MDIQWELYFSQSEACKKYKISARRFKRIIRENNLNLIEDEKLLHTLEGTPYLIKTVYVKKIDFIRVNI